MNSIWLQVILQALPILVKAVETVAADTGKSPEQAAEDVINHLTPGKPNAPELS